MNGRSMRRWAAIFCGAALGGILAGCGPTDDAPHAGDSPGADEAKVISNRIPVPPDVRANLGIDFVKVERRRVEDTVRLPGRCAIEAAGRCRYRAVFPGRLTIAVRPHQVVTSGDALYSIVSPGWRELQATLGALAAAAETSRAAEIAARSTREEARATLDESKARLAKHASRVKAAATHVAALARAAKTWEAEVERLGELVTRGGGVAGKLAAARASLTAIRVDEAKATEEEAELAERGVALEASVRRAELAAPRYRAEADARAVETRATQERFQLGLARAASRLGTTVEALEAKDASGRAAWRTMDRVVVRALQPGRVEPFHWANGDWAGEGDLVISTVDDRKIAFHADVLQADLEALASIDRGRIVPASGRGRPVPCTVRLGVSGNAARRTFPVHAEPTGDAAWLRPGIAAFLEMVREGGREEMAVPLRCVVDDAGKRVVFKRDPADANQVIRLEVETGVDDGAWVVVDGSLMVGDDVVAEGAYELNLTGKGKAPAGGHFHADGTWHAGDDH